MVSVFTTCVRQSDGYSVVAVLPTCSVSLLIAASWAHLPLGVYAVTPCAQPYCVLATWTAQRNELAPYAHCIRVCRNHNCAGDYKRSVSSKHVRQRRKIRPSPGNWLDQYGSKPQGCRTATMSTRLTLCQRMDASSDSWRSTQRA